MGQIKKSKLILVTAFKINKKNKMSLVKPPANKLHGFAHRAVRRMLWQAMAWGVAMSVAYVGYGPMVVNKAYEDFYATYEQPTDLMEHFFEEKPEIPEGMEDHREKVNARLAASRWFKRST